MITVLLRCIIIYALLLVALRLTGKRQIGELEVSELITTLILSEVAVTPISDPDIPVIYAIIPIFALCSFEVALTFFTSKFPKFRSAVGGRPNPVIKDGKIDQQELKNLRLSVAELMEQLRVSGNPDPYSVKYAFFEEDGQLSVIPNGTEYIYTLICEGYLNTFNMKESGWNEARILKQLKKHNAEIDDIFLMTVDNNDNINIIYKED